MNKEQKITIIRFDAQLLEREIPSFRGAIILQTGNNPLYHNHKEGSTLQFRYPRIQYKVLGGTAALVGWDEGAEALESDFSLKQSCQLQIGNNLQTFTVKEKSTTFFSADESAKGDYRYIIRNWLPFSTGNYRIWRNKNGLAERISMLDSILRGNILTLYKAFGVFFTRDISAKIVDMSSGVITFKGVKMNSFNIVITSDVALPLHLGIGKGVSHGFGVIEKL